MKTITSFLRTHRQLLLIVACSFFFFLFFSTPLFAQSPEEVATTKASGDGIWGVADTVLDTIAGIIYYFCVGIGGIFIGIGGWMLDTVVTQTILEADTWLSPAGGETLALGDSIQALWVVIRDMLNILFIFSLIYIGIKTILDSQQAETQRKLGYLILAAFLINFSLFFTQIIVDFSNIAAIQIYNQIQTGLGAGANIAGQQLSSSGIAAGFMNIVQVGTFFSADTASLSTMAFTQQIIYSLLMLVFFIIAGIIFMMGAVLLIRRFITIVLIMIFSPTLFAGWILPAFEEHQKKWRRKLLENAFFAPAFFFMLFLSIKVLQSLSSLITDSNTQGFSANTDTEGYIKLVFFFALAIGFLYASIKIGESMSIAGASGVMKTTQRAIGGTTAGLAARAYRNTAGRAANRLAESDWMKDRAGKNVAYKSLFQGAQTLGDSSGDIRALGVGGGMIGKARKGGYKTVSKEIIDKEEKFAKSLGEVSDEDETVKHLEHHEHELHDELEQMEETKKEALKTLQKAKNEGNADEIARAKEAATAAQKAVTDKKDEIKKAKEAITNEKNRRIAGSVADVAAYKATTDSLKTKETELKTLNEQYQAAKEAGNKDEKRRIAEIISVNKSEIKTLKQQAKAKLQTMGYAGNLETTSRFASWTYARNRTQDRDAGKALRKKYTKKSMKDDAHGGGGHDNHGGDDHGGGDDAHGGGGHGGGH